jgi:hypothetical protein
MHGLWRSLFPPHYSKTESQVNRKVVSLTELLEATEREVVPVHISKVAGNILRVYEDK